MTLDGLNGINEPEESYIQEPDEYLEQDNLDPIEEANDSFTLSEEINGMEEIQTEDAQMPMNMELLRNPHRILEIPKSRSELRGEIPEAWRIKLWMTKDKRVPLLMRGVK